MKLAVSGKGGVGKTTFASLLIRTLSDQGKKVLAIDADPDANLAAGLGIPDADRIVPIAEMKELICERTGAQPGTVGGYFKLNPEVDDLPEEMSDTPEPASDVLPAGNSLSGLVGRPLDEVEKLFARLSKCEPLSQREVLQLFAEGHSAKQVAKLLQISVRTAENHKAHIMQLLGATSTADLVQCAIRHGLIAPA